MATTIDVSKVPALLSALGPAAQLALVTADGVTWTAAVVTAGQPAYVYSGTGGPDPATALSALVAAITSATAAVAQTSAATATAVAAAATAVPVQPNGKVVA